MHELHTRKCMFGPYLVCHAADTQLQLHQQTVRVLVGRSSKFCTDRLMDSFTFFGECTRTLLCTKAKPFTHSRKLCREIQHAAEPSRAEHHSGHSNPHRRSKKVGVSGEKQTHLLLVQMTRTSSDKQRGKCTERRRLNSYES